MSDSALPQSKKPHWWGDVDNEESNQEECKGVRHIWGNLYICSNFSMNLQIRLQKVMSVETDSQTSESYSCQGEGMRKE